MLVTEVLLAKYKQEKSRLGFLSRLLHGASKWMIRRAVDAIAKKMQPVIEYKRREGWLNPEIKQLYDDINWLIACDDHTRAHDNGGGDADRRLWNNIRDILCVQLDEDTYYNIRFWVLMHRIHDLRWNEAYDIALNRANAYWNYAEIYNVMKHENDPLPRKDMAWE